MSQNKKAQIRYLEIDKCIRSAKRYYFKDLLEAVNIRLEEEGCKPIGRTQLYNDLNDLEFSTYKVPIVRKKDGKWVYFEYEDPTYSITKQPLNESEAQQIREALIVLSRFKGTPQFEWIQELIPKIEKEFKLKTSLNEVIGFDDNIDLKGLEHFGGLYDAIINGFVLEIEYQAFQSSKSEKIVHPYFLKQYNNRWFLFGLNSIEGRVENLPLDRIISFSQTKDVDFIANNIIDFSDYFDEIIGVTRFSDSVIENVQLWFEAVQAKYIDTKPLHGSQKLKWQSDGSAIVSIEVALNKELEHLILRFGEKCKVLAPQNLKTTISNRIKKAYDHY